MQIGILDWLNECGLDSYPLVESIGVDNFILDANFIQFDSFKPLLSSVVVTSSAIVLNITFDTETKVITVNRSGFTEGQISKIYATSGRYLGKLIFGGGAQTLWDNFLNQTLNTNVNFSPVVVKTIPSSAGVFSLNGLTGALTLGHDANIFYGVSGQNVIVNAVGLASSTGLYALKTINGVAPTNNNVFITDSNVIKLIASTASSITVDLATPDLYNTASIIPSA